MMGEEKGKVYLLNTLVVPIDFDQQSKVIVETERISPEEAKKILSGGFESAVGHQGAAVFLSRLLGIEVPTNRQSIFMRPGDTGIHFFPKQRLPEGSVLSDEEMKKVPFWLVKSRVLEPGT
jgi:hypothetical protein